MKAIVQRRYGEPQVLRFGDVDEPTVGEDGVLVDVRAASVGAWDWHYLGPEPQLMRLAGFGIRRPKQLIAGQDFAGVVKAVGPAVHGFQPGDEVYGEAPGSWAELVVAPSTHVARKPRNLSFVEAAAVPLAANTALIALRDRARLEPGQRVAIIGASGGVGTFAVQIARSLGANVTAVCGPTSVPLVRSLGADETIDYTVDDVVLHERAFDAVLQLAGTEPWWRLRRAVTRRGTLVLSSGEGGRWIGGLPRIAAAAIASPFARPRIEVFEAKPSGPNLDDLTALIESGEVAPVIDRTFPLADAAEALRRHKDGHTRGKIVLEV